MALLRAAVAVVSMAMASLVAAQDMAAEIYNNTRVDLCVEGKSKGECTEIQPMQTAHVILRPRQWINFGMEAHEYRLPKKLTGSSLLRLQAEGDGRLYLVPSEITVPAQPLPRQPAGFPLKPVRVVDLT
jgi:hypothetical protein